jgi:ABC-type multidrug transport system fused ATPase/permease subunit
MQSRIHTSKFVDKQDVAHIEEKISGLRLMPFSPGPKSSKFGLDEQNERVLEEKEATQAMHFLEDVKRAHRNKVITESVIFGLSTAFQVYSGIKAVSFDMSGFQNSVFFPALMVVLIVSVNAESVICCLMIETFAKEEGIEREDIHGHPLFFSKANSGHTCDLCRKRILKGYRCWACDFDVCLKCMSGKTVRAEGEGGVRGDKGMRSEKEVTLKPTQYFKRALWLASSEWFLLFCAFLSLMLASVTNLLSPIYSGHVFNAIKDEDHGPFLHNVRIFVILSLSSGLFGSCRSLCFRVVSRRLSYLTRNKLFEGIIRQDIAFYDASQTGDLISRLSWDCNAMLQPISNLLGSTLQSILFFFGGLIMSFVISWRLSMLAFTTMLPIIHLTSKYAVFSQRLNREIFTFIGMANSIAQEAMANIRTVRAFSTEDVELKRYRQETKEALKRGVRDALANSGTIFLSNLIDYGASTLILLYGGLLVMSKDQNKAISIGMLYAYLRFWDMIQTSYQSLQGVMNSFTKAAGAAQRVLSLMDSLPDIDPNAGAIAAANMSWSVEFDNVFFVYQMRPDVVVLKSISLKMESGEVCALVGPSGCGKTTIISLILRYYDPTSGRILIGGRELQDFNLKHLHKHIGYVSQETQMFAKTIEENIGYGREGEYSQEELVAACRAANAHDFIMAFPSGYQTRIGERGVRLSGGQRQRIAIARMMLRKPKLLLLDEATSALDAESEALVQQSLDNLLDSDSDHQYTVVLVAHRLSTVVNANQICVVDKGVVKERGNHDSLMELKGTYCRLVSKQLEKTANMLYDNQ